MKLQIDTTGKTFTVTKAVEEKKDQNGRQKADRETNELLWSVQVMALDETGGEVINVTLAGNAMPKVNVGSVVVPATGRRVIGSVRSLTRGSRRSKNW